MAWIGNQFCEWQEPFVTQNSTLNFLKLCENDFWVMRKLSLASDLVCILGIMLDYNSFMLNTNVVVRP
jgi:hypothetical protein